MEKLHETRFPGETKEYRDKRFELLAAEAGLREQVEAVAELRRQLPLGGALKEDYLFHEGAAELADLDSEQAVRLSELFGEGKSSLIVYGFMYGPDAKAPCPLCTSLLDSLNGAARHARERVNLVVVAKAPLRTLRKWAAERGWNHLRLLSSHGNSFNLDYAAENAKGDQFPSLNVFRKTGAGIFHFYNSELFFAPLPAGGNARHVDQIWPLWNLLDLTPEGRGADWFPQLSYP